MSNLEWIDRMGKTIGTLGDAADYSDVELSPDGKRAAVSMLSGTNRDIWIYDIPRAVRTRFTFDPAAEVGPIWSPDGARILFSSNRTGNFDLYQKMTGGTGAEEPVFVRPPSKVSYSWSPMVISSSSRHVADRTVEVVPTSGCFLFRGSASRFLSSRPLSTRAAREFRRTAGG
jgi:dipeptidyl aminopeptidase/acylaminoacyl peptidase